MLNNGSTFLFVAAYRYRKNLPILHVLADFFDSEMDKTQKV